MENPIANFGVIDNNFDATLYGWRETKHSDYFDVDNEMWFPRIYPWYDAFLGSGIRIGEE